jgi:hypothetical protein
MFRQRMEEEQEQEQAFWRGIGVDMFPEDQMF